MSGLRAEMSDAAGVVAAQWASSVAASAMALLRIEVLGLAEQFAGGRAMAGPATKPQDEDADDATPAETDPDAPDDEAETDETEAGYDNMPV